MTAVARLHDESGLGKPSFPLVPQILLIENDVLSAQRMQEYFTSRGVSITIEASALKAVERIKSMRPDLVIIEQVLSGKSGLDICAEVRCFYQGAILMIGDGADEVDQILGLELGADEFICKPITPRLLESKIKALLRARTRGAEHLLSQVAFQPVIEVNNLSLNTQTLCATIGNSTVELSATEYDILYLLTSNVGRIVSRNDVFRKIRGFEYDGNNRFVDVQISRLRRKLKYYAPHTDIIKTIRGKGYLIAQ